MLLGLTLLRRASPLWRRLYLGLGVPHHFDAVVLILWMVGSIQQGRLRIGYSPLYVPMALFFALGLVQLLLSSDPHSHRHEGVAYSSSPRTSLYSSW